MPTFPHAMLREIYEQPQALERTIDLYLNGRSLKPEVAAELAHWPNAAGEVLIAASGSSRHSGLYGEILSRISAASPSTSSMRANTVVAAAQAMSTCVIPACLSSRNPAKQATP